MFRRNRTYRARHKRTGQWAGFSFGQAMASGTIYGFPIWDTSDSAEVNMAGVATTRRIVGDVCTIANTGLTAGGLFYWYINVFPTDVAELTPADLIYSPASSDIDAMQKRPLAQGVHSVPIGNIAGQGINIHMDVKAKHRMTDEDILYFVCLFSGTGTPVMNGQLRAYCSWG